MKKLSLLLLLGMVFTLSACQQPNTKMQNVSVGNGTSGGYSADAIPTEMSVSDVLGNVPNRLDTVLQDGASALSIAADVITFDVRTLYNISIEPMPVNMEVAVSALFSQKDSARLVPTDEGYYIPPTDTSGDVLMDAGLQWRSDGFLDFSDYRINYRNAIQLAASLPGEHMSVKETTNKGHSILAALGLEGAYFYDASSFYVPEDSEAVYHYLSFVPVYEGLPIVYDHFITGPRPIGNMSIGDDGVMSVNGQFLYQQTGKTQIQCIMPFNDILNILKENIGKQNQLAPVPVTRITLCYYPQAPTEQLQAIPMTAASQNTISAQYDGSYSLRPVWCFYADTQDPAYTNELRDNGYRVGIICVDAVTGEIIFWP